MCRESVKEISSVALVCWTRRACATSFIKRLYFHACCLEAWRYQRREILVENTRIELIVWQASFLLSSLIMQSHMFSQLVLSEVALLTLRAFVRSKINHLIRWMPVIDWVIGIFYELVKNLPVVSVSPFMVLFVSKRQKVFIAIPTLACLQLYRSQALSILYYSNVFS